MKTDLFEGITADQVKRAKIRSLPPAERNVVIFFTPRSGSSWLTDILAQTGQFGRANELFNPNFLPSMASSLQAEDIDDYIYAARRRFSIGNVFSFEITAHQLNAVFKNPEEFQERFPDSQYVWLVRRDIVAQAVSLTKMVNKKISHAPQLSEGDLETADGTFEYSDKEIRKWIGHILSAEKQTEAFFANHRIQPLRLIYEDMISIGARATATKLLAHTGTKLPSGFIFDEQHHKVGTLRNEEFVEKFKRQHRVLTLLLAWQRRHLTRSHLCQLQ